LNTCKPLCGRMDSIFQGTTKSSFATHPTPALWLGFLLVRFWPALCYSVGSTLKTCDSGGSHLGGGLSVRDWIRVKLLMAVANTSPLWWGSVYPNDPGTVPPGQLVPYVWEFFTCHRLFVFSPTPVGVSPITEHSHSVGVHPP
jgi:hypothetical protein